jgi:hypothetical protein
MDYLRLSTAEKWALVTTALGLLHHVDHVLRVNHSGWPFTADVNAFTYSLAVYPLIAVLLWARGKERFRVVLAFLLFLFPTLSHVLIETPVTQYRTWALRPDVNMLGVSSPVLGVAAVVITVSLSAAALVTFVAFLREARQSPSTEQATRSAA